MGEKEEKRGRMEKKMMRKRGCRMSLGAKGAGQWVGQKRGMEEM